MNITVHADKIRAEIGAKRRRRDQQGQVSAGELEVLVEKLKGGSIGEIAQRLGVKYHTAAQRLSLMRAALDVHDDVQLAYLAYERGWVVIEGGA